MKTVALDPSRAARRVALLARQRAAARRGARRRLVAQQVRRAC